MPAAPIGQRVKFQHQGQLKWHRHLFRLRTWLLSILLIQDQVSSILLTLHTVKPHNCLIPRLRLLTVDAEAAWNLEPMDTYGLVWIQILRSSLTLLLSINKAQFTRHCYRTGTKHLLNSYIDISNISQPHRQKHQVSALSASQTPVPKPQAAATHVKQCDSKAGWTWLNMMAKSYDGWECTAVEWQPLAELLPLPSSLLVV